MAVTQRPTTLIFILWSATTPPSACHPVGLEIHLHRFGSFSLQCQAQRPLIFLLYWSNNFAEFRPIVETHPRSQPSIGVANVKPFGVICVWQHVKVEEARFSLSSRASSITYPALVLNRVNLPVHKEVSKPHCGMLACSA